MEKPRICYGTPESRKAKLLANLRQMEIKRHKGQARCDGKGSFECLYNRLRTG